MLNQLKAEMNLGRTENGALTNKSSGDAVLNFFGVGGALRNRSESDILELFTRAYGEDKLLALKVMFFLRDARGGQGERRTFRTILKYMGDAHADIVGKNIGLIPFFGRWDDLYELFGTKSQTYAEDLIKFQFEEDMKTDRPSLMGKWLKSENASSVETKKLGKATRKALGLNPKEYRKALSSLREKIDVLERKMVSKEWSEIEYGKIPSKAGLVYRGAFLRNDEERYSQFISDVNSGKAKVNAKTLYPYEIVRKVIDYGFSQEDADVLEALWNNQADYTNGSKENALAIVDTSGSMEWEQNGLALHSAVSIGLYLAERNTGIYKNHFITFSDRPEMQEIQGSNLVEKVRNIRRASWSGSTNIEAVFNLVLNTAIKNNIPQEEMVKRLYILSDMEFNQATSGRTDITLMNSIKERFEQYGYQIPEICFINVNARNTQFPMTMHDAGVALVSGMNPTIFEHLMKGEFLDPYKVMMEVLNSERYSVVTV